MPPQQREQIKQKRIEQRNKWRSMSPSERQKMREKIRQRRIERFQR